MDFRSNPTMGEQYGYSQVKRVIGNEYVVSRLAASHSLPKESMSRRMTPTVFPLGPTARATNKLIIGVVKHCKGSPISLAVFLIQRTN
jgi:hypothetical protein